MLVAGSCKTKLPWCSARQHMYVPKAAIGTILSPHQVKVHRTHTLCNSKSCRCQQRGSENRYGLLRMSVLRIAAHTHRQCLVSKSEVIAISMCTQLGTVAELGLVSASSWVVQNKVALVFCKAAYVRTQSGNRYNPVSTAGQSALSAYFMNQQVLPVPAARF